MVKFEGKWKYQSYRPDPGSVAADPTSPDIRSLVAPWRGDHRPRRDHRHAWSSRGRRSSSLSRSKSRMEVLEGCPSRQQ